MLSETRRALPKSLLFLGAIVAEKLTVLHLPSGWMRGAVQIFGGAPAAFGLALLFFGWRRLSSARLQVRWNRSAIVVHLLLLLVLCGVQIVYGHSFDAPSSRGPLFLGLAALWTALIPLLVFTLVLSFVPLRALFASIRSLGTAWFYAFAVTAAIVCLRRFGADAWASSSSGIVRFIQQACFQQTRFLLQQLYPLVLSNQQKHTLGTLHYQVEVSWLCSGVEGLLLVTLLIGLWIVFFRKELIVARALLLAPVALVLTWCANLARLTAFIWIGDHGHAHLADVGFHAQAGWVSLNLITLGCLFLAQNHPWFRKDGRREIYQPNSLDTNETVVYLLPFTLIVATSLVTQGLAEGFEAWYVLRFVVAVAIFWTFRAHYRQIDWRFSWRAVIAGVAIGAIWIAINLKFRAVAADNLITASALAHMTWLPRWAWIGTRVAAASLTVPIAEELAFRGFVARRVMRADFENLPYYRMNWFSLTVSSLAFGAMHGHMWAAGVLTGAVLWWLSKSQDRLGEAVAAHAMANAVIAIAAVRMHDYFLW